jgi:hypothetical protein
MRNGDVVRSVLPEHAIVFGDLNDPEARSTNSWTARDQLLNDLDGLSDLSEGGDSMLGRPDQVQEPRLASR